MQSFFQWIINWILLGIKLHIAMLASDIAVPLIIIVFYGIFLLLYSLKVAWDYRGVK